MGKCEVMLRSGINKFTAHVLLAVQAATRGNTSLPLHYIHLLSITLIALPFNSEWKFVKTTLELRLIFRRFVITHKSTFLCFVVL